jgi:hypothetical protein
MGETLFPIDRAWHFERSPDLPGTRELLIARLYQYPGSTDERPEQGRPARSA